MFSVTEALTCHGLKESGICTSNLFRWRAERRTNHCIGFESITVLVYKPGVLVTVSLTSLTPLPTSKKTNYQLQNHLFLSKFEKMSDWSSFPFSRFPECAKYEYLGHVHLHPWIHGGTALVSVGKLSLMERIGVTCVSLGCATTESLANEGGFCPLLDSRLGGAAPKWQALCKTTKVSEP